MCLTQEDYSDGARSKCDWMTGSRIGVWSSLVGWVVVSWVIQLLVD